MKKRVEGHSGVGDAGITSSCTGGKRFTDGGTPGCGDAFGPGFKFWLHHLASRATWDKFCVTSPN